MGFASLSFFRAKAFVGLDFEALREYHIKFMSDEVIEKRRGVGRIWTSRDTRKTMLDVVLALLAS